MPPLSSMHSIGKLWHHHVNKKRGIPARPLGVGGAYIQQTTSPWALHPKSKQILTTEQTRNRRGGCGHLQHLEYSFSFSDSKRRWVVNVVFVTSESDAQISRLVPQPITNSPARPAPLSCAHYSTDRQMSSSMHCHGRATFFLVHWHWLQFCMLHIFHFFYITTIGGLKCYTWKCENARQKLLNVQ